LLGPYGLSQKRLLSSSGGGFCWSAMVRAVLGGGLCWSSMVRVISGGGLCWSVMVRAVLGGGLCWSSMVPAGEAGEAGGGVRPRSRVIGLRIRGILRV
jgi:hypothetical protein